MSSAKLLSSSSAPRGDASMAPSVAAMLLEDASLQIAAVSSQLENIKELLPAACDTERYLSCVDQAAEGGQERVIKTMKLQTTAAEELRSQVESVSLI